MSGLSGTGGVGITGLSSFLSSPLQHLINPAATATAAAASANLPFLPLKKFPILLKNPGFLAPSFTAFLAPALPFSAASAALAPA